MPPAPSCSYAAEPVFPEPGPLRRAMLSVRRTMHKSRRTSASGDGAVFAESFKKHTESPESPPLV